MEPGATALLLYVVTVKPGKFAGTCASTPVANRAPTITAIVLNRPMVFMLVIGTGFQMRVQEPETVVTLEAV
jgi:hypothetical protein